MERPRPIYSPGSKRLTKKVFTRLLGARPVYFRDLKRVTKKVYTQVMGARPSVGCEHLEVPHLEKVLNLDPGVQLRLLDTEGK